MIISKRQGIKGIETKSILGLVNLGEEDIKIKKIEVSVSFDAEVYLYYVPIENIAELTPSGIVPYGKNENVTILSDLALTEKVEPIKSFVFKGTYPIVTQLDNLLVSSTYGIVIRVKTYNSNSIISANIII